jgi:F-type H+-transporting ATPase subunit alpha
LDALPLPAVIEFRHGLHDALGTSAADAVQQIEAGGTLDDDHKQILLQALKSYIQTVAPPPPPPEAPETGPAKASAEPGEVGGQAAGPG